MKIFLALILFVSINYDMYHSRELTIDDLVFPTPLHLQKGDEKIILDRNTKFIFLYDEKLKSPIFLEILEFYGNLLHKNKIKNEKVEVKNEVVLINLKVKNLIMKKFSNKYSTNFEEYDLSIRPSNKKENMINVEIEAFYLNGLLRSLETLSQIIFFNDDYDNYSNSQRYEIYNLPIKINDRPRFGYRGLMIDTSRHFISLKKIMRIIDGLMYNKMNVLHWHITDDEYFGFGSKMMKNQKYTFSKTELKYLINYAEIRGVTIIFEIDNPSHTRSWKDLSYNNKKLSDLAIVRTKPEYGVLDPSKNTTYKIVKKLVKEVVSLYTKDPDMPDDKDNSILIHLGGDEVLSDMWDSLEIKDFMKNNNLNDTSQLENFYFNKISEIIPSENIYLYWVNDKSKQIYDIYHKDNSVLMYWGIHSNLKTFLDDVMKNKIDYQKESKIILASGDFLYLDCGSGNKYGDGTWCGDYKTWKKIYNFPIFENYGSFSIIGSEAVLFGELADENSIMGKIFPRINSLSEILWRDEQKDRNIKNFFYKLLIHNKRLINRGIEVISITSQLCEENPDECIDRL